MMLKETDLEVTGVGRELYTTGTWNVRVSGDYLLL